MVTIHVMSPSNSSFRCSGSQIEISIMKTCSDDQCEWLLIYDHDDLSDLHIEINWLKKIIFCCFLSLKILNKLCIINAWKNLRQKFKKSFKCLNYFQKIKVSWKYLSGMGFHFLTTVFENLGLDINFHFLKKKVWISAF